MTKPLSPRQETWLRLRVAAARDTSLPPATRFDLALRVCRDVLTDDEKTALTDELLARPLLSKVA